MTSPDGWIPPPVGLHDGEPEVAPWRVEPVAAVLDRLLADRATGRAHVIGLDGRGGAGKSTVAGRLADAARARGLAATVVHTDDIAWHHSFFGWGDLLRRDVLEPARRGEPVDHVPRAWAERGRTGSISVPADCAVLLVEGCGSCRRALRDLLDSVVWVQSDTELAARRLVDRDGDTAEIRAFIADWEAEERPFMVTERVWDRADVVVLGTAEPGDGDVLVTGTLRSTRARPGPGELGVSGGGDPGGQ